MNIALICCPVRPYVIVSEALAAQSIMQSNKKVLQDQDRLQGDRFHELLCIEK